ncbi:MAG: PaaR repeat-containing protein [Chloroflexi bacterium]|nr:MAG: PaaR repeat-containing protein [Chloroflexota bacterium]
MPFPAARVGDVTVTGDAITGPGVPNVLIAGMPASVMGDLVNGAVCVGAITMGSPTVLIGGRPAARITSQVTGANPITGIPVTTAVAMGAPTVLIA